MNSVPKTTRHADAKYEEPYWIEQVNHTGSGTSEINNYAYPLTKWGDSYFEPSCFCYAIFRVYPKGENPMSVKRKRPISAEELVEVIVSHPNFT